MSLPPEMQSLLFDLNAYSAKRHGIELGSAMDVQRPDLRPRDVMGHPGHPADLRELDHAVHVRHDDTVVAIDSPRHAPGHICIADFAHDCHTPGRVCLQHAWKRWQRWSASSAKEVLVDGMPQASSCVEQLRGTRITSGASAATMKPAALRVSVGPLEERVNSWLSFQAEARAAVNQARRAVLGPAAQPGAQPSYARPRSTKPVGLAMALQDVRERPGGRPLLAHASAIRDADLARPSSSRPQRPEVQRALPARTPPPLPPRVNVEDASATLLAQAQAQAVPQQRSRPQSADRKSVV